MQLVDDATTFTDRITLVRTRQRLSCAEMGRLLGVSGKTVARWESGDNDVPFHKVVQYAEIGDEPVSWFAEAPLEKSTNTERYGWDKQLGLFDDTDDLVIDLRDQTTPTVAPLIHEHFAAA